MKTKTLLIVLLFAVQCIERSFGTVVILSCTDDVTCLQTVYFKKLYVGLVPILVTDKYDQNDPKNSGIINFFQNKTQNFKLLKVFVSFIKNKALAVYLDPRARRPINVKYPYVAMMKNHRVLSGRSYGFDKTALEDMLKEADKDNTHNYSNFSVGLLNALANHTAKFRPIDQAVLDWIAGMETGGYESPGSSTQHRNVSRSTPPPGASSTTAAAHVPRRKSGGRETVVNTSSGLSMLPVSQSPSTKPVASSTSVAAHSVSRNTSTLFDLNELPVRSPSDGDWWLNSYFDNESNPPSPDPVPAPVTSKRQPSTVAGEIFETDNAKKQRV